MDINKQTLQCSGVGSEMGAQSSTRVIFPNISSRAFLYHVSAHKQGQPTPISCCTQKGMETGIPEYRLLYLSSCSHIRIEQDSLQSNSF